MALWTLEYLDTGAWLRAKNTDSLVVSSGRLVQWHDHLGRGEVFSASGDQRPTMAAAALSGTDLPDFNGVDQRLENNSDSIRDLYRYAPCAWSLALYKKKAADEAPIGRFVLSSSTSGGVSLRYVLSAGRVTTGHQNRPGVAGRRADDDTFVTAVALDPQADYVAVLGYLDYAAGSFRLWVNGELDAEEDYSSMGLSSDTRAMYPVTIAAHVNSGSHADIQLAELAMGRSALSQDDVDRAFGYLLHDWGLSGLLSAEHPYKATAPMTSKQGLAGRVRIDGSPVICPVRIVSASGALIEEITSDATGYYEWLTGSTDPVYAYPAAPAGHQPIIHGPITPAELPED